MTSLQDAAQAVLNAMDGLGHLDASVHVLRATLAESAEVSPRDYAFRVAMLARAEPDLPIESVVFQASLPEREIGSPTPVADGLRVAGSPPSPERAALIEQCARACEEVWTVANDPSGVLDMAAARIRALSARRSPVEEIVRELRRLSVELFRPVSPDSALPQVALDFARANLAEAADRIETKYGGKR